MPGGEKMKKRNNYIKEEDFRRYLENRMSEAERNRFERELQKHPFEAEAMEGLENTPTNLQAELKEVKSRIAGKKRKNTYRYWAAAATVLLLVTAGLIWYQLGDEPPTPEVAVWEEDEAAKRIAPATTDSAAEVSAVSESEELEEETRVETQTAKREESVAKPEAEPQQQQQPEIAAASQPKSPEQKTRKKPLAQNQMAAKSNQVKSARDTKTVSYNLTGSEAALSTRLQIKGLTDTKNETIALTEKIEFPVDSNDIFPDSFRTIPAEEREKVQEIQGVAIQDNVELEADAYLSDVAARPVGGMEKWNNYLEKQAVLPATYSGKKKIVKLLLEIDSQGNITDIHNRNKADSLLFERSREIIRNGPKWRPKVVNGEKVQSEVKLKIDFQKK